MDNIFMKLSVLHLHYYVSIGESLKISLIYNFYLIIKYIYVSFITYN